MYILFLQLLHKIGHCLNMTGLHSGNEKMVNLPCPEEPCLTLSLNKCAHDFISILQLHYFMQYAFDEFPVKCTDESWFMKVSQQIATWRKLTGDRVGYHLVRQDEFQFSASTGAKTCSEHGFLFQ